MQGFDEALDRLLDADIDKELMEPWLGRLYRSRRSPMATIVFLKMAGLRVEEISAILHIPVEQIYRYECRILRHYRYTCQNIAHQQFMRAKRKPITDYYE